MKPDFHPIFISRRNFLTLGGMGLAGLLLGQMPNIRLGQASADTARRLVVLEMNGANDGLNTVIPYGSGAYYDLRRRLGVNPADVLKLDSMWGLHPALPLLKKRFEAGQAAIFRGVGHPTDPDLSHFAMQDVWRAGRPEGFRGTDQTGWLGRLLDVIGDPKAPLAGFCLSPSISQALLGQSDKSGAAEYPYSGTLYFPDGLVETLRTSIQHLAVDDDTDSPTLKAARRGMNGSLPISDFLNLLGRVNKTYPKTDTGYALSFAAQILAVNDWIRVVHIPLPLDFDTHVDQINRQKGNLSDLDSAIDAFLNELETFNLADQTLVLTTSEFGRRVEDNGGDGTDHGTANSLLIMGKQVKGGLYGEPPSLTRLDGNRNLIATMSFQDLLATVAEGWMNAPASEVIPGGRPWSIFNR